MAPDTQCNGKIHSAIQNQVWHSALTKENTSDLERIQKTSLKIILKEIYKIYENTLEKLDLQNLAERREFLCLSFPKKCLKNEKMRKYF